MSLTGKLAYSQLKINRLRTMWTLVGILLSTSLITAVCSFAASALAMISDFPGAGAEGRAMMLSLLLVPVVIISIIIVVMSVIVISNAFRVSAGERTAQFGILKSVGATKRQISATVMYESVWLSALGIPLGLAAGLGLAYLGIGVANSLLGELNALTQIMIYEFSIYISFTVAWQALLAAALLSFIAIAFSAWLPARKAAKISAIESIRGAGEVKTEHKPLRTNPLIETVFGFEGTLAAKNMKRSRRNFRSALCA